MNTVAQRRDYNNSHIESEFANCGRAMRESLTNWLAANKHIVKMWHANYIKDRDLNGLEILLQDFKLSDKVDHSTVASGMFKRYLERLISEAIDTLCVECGKFEAEYNDMCEKCFDAYQKGVEDSYFGGTTSVKPKVQEALSLETTNGDDTATNETNPSVFSSFMISCNQEAVNSNAAASLIPSNEENKPSNEPASKPEKPVVSKCPTCGKCENCICWELPVTLQSTKTSQLTLLPSSATSTMTPENLLKELGRREIMEFAKSLYQLEGGLNLIDIKIYEELAKFGITRKNLLYENSKMTRLAHAWKMLERWNSYRLPKHINDTYKIKASSKRDGKFPIYEVSVELNKFDGIHWQGGVNCQCEDNKYKEGEHKGNCWHALATRILFYACLLFDREYSGQELQKVA